MRTSRDFRKKNHFVLLFALHMILFSSVSSPVCASHSLYKANKSSQAVPTNIPEGKVTVATVQVGPFDIHRRYKSMEGPYLKQKVRVSDLIASHKVILPESMIKFVEDEPRKDRFLPDKRPPFVVNPAGLKDTSTQERQLLWLKGVRIEVLDENDNVMPSAEFFCHMVTFVDKQFRNRQAFPQAEPVSNERLLFLSQGLPVFFFPQGFAVPVASDEEWVLSFQAANRTTDRHRRVKHRCTFFFIKDTDLQQPLKSLHWYMPYIAVLQNSTDKNVCLTKNHQPDCMAASAGVRAPNSVPASTVYDVLGRKLIGHWLVPPGTHTYRFPLELEPSLLDFSAENRMIHAVWCHVHPLCTTSSLVDISQTRRKPIFTAKVSTSRSKGLEIGHIDNIVSQAGIPVAKGHHYELEATYVNNTGLPQDAMINDGVFCADKKFVRPEWAKRKGKHLPN